MKTSVLLAVILISSVLSISGCTRYENIEALKSVEVRDYNGEKLSSVADFRENSISGPQYVNITRYELKVTGLVEKPANYSYEDVLKNDKYTKVVTLNCVEGWSTKILWEGVKVSDIISKSAPSKDAKTAIFKAYDGYTTSFPIDYIMNNDIIIAYGMNNVTIPPERGYPFQLVAESKWGYKWIKWITWIELSNDTNYRGYWESRGYSNNGNLNQSFNVG
jgi:DMSO/TMAO reductase YedYZ molybdopterin-dependent catalytic subunit